MFKRDRDRGRDTGIERGREGGRQAERGEPTCAATVRPPLHYLVLVAWRWIMVNTRKQRGPLTQRGVKNACSRGCSGAVYDNESE